MREFGFRICWVKALISLAMCCLFGVTSADAAEHPNFVVVLVDDLGWTDVGCYGSDLHETPHIDQLAREGMKFTNAYAACTVCSPTRAALLTGKYPARLHLTDWIAGHARPHAKLSIPDWNMKLGHDEVTLAEALKPAGYATAHVGKWHLCPPSESEEAAFYPTTQGFDVNIGGTRWGSPGSYFFPYARPGAKIQMPVKNMPPGGHDGEYLTDRLTDEAIKLITQWRSRPFLLYLAHYAVHTPIEGKPDLTEKYAKKISPSMRHKNATYAAMMHSLDDSISRIADTLEELGLAENTIVVFASDNGGYLGREGDIVTTNVPLRVGKGSAYEGGVRVPFLFKWPGVTQAGSVCEEPVITMDIYPTLLQIANVSGDSRHNANVDGISLVPLLKDADATLNRDALYWHYPHYHPGGATPYGAIRQRDWKLIEFYEDMHVELYNLKQDIGEEIDLASQMPQKADELREKLHEWRESISAQMPTPNPRYRASE